MIYVCQGRRWPVQEKYNICCNEQQTEILWSEYMVLHMVHADLAVVRCWLSFSGYYKVAWLLELVHSMKQCLPYIVLKVMIAIRLEKSKEIHMTAYFWDLSYSVLVGLFFFFLSSFLFVCLIVCFVYEHFTCTWEIQALLLHMFPCTHYKLSNWSQYSILCSRPKTPILEFECKLLRGIHTECSEHFKWTWYFFAWADRAVLCSSKVKIL